MASPIVTLLGALIGAVIGSMGSVALGKRLDRLWESEKTRQILVQQHLFQLQDAVESLWFRVHNIAIHGGRVVMDDEYFEVSTLYAFARVLAAERILALAGIYPLLKKYYGRLGVVLQENRVDSKLENMGFHRYHRLTLAESVINLGHENLRVKTYSEFRSCYEADNSVEKKWLLPAKNSILQTRFLSEDPHGLLSSLRDTSKALSKATKIEPHPYIEQTTAAHSNHLS